MSSIPEGSSITGRLGTSQPAFQNITIPSFDPKRATDIRRCFVPDIRRCFVPDSNVMLVGMDIAVPDTLEAWSSRVRWLLLNTDKPISNPVVVDSLSPSTEAPPARKVIAAFVCVTHEGKVLLGKHPVRQKWEFPGGKQNRGESICDAARREVREETNLELGPLRLVHCTESDDWFAALFTASPVNPDDLKNMEPDKNEGFDWFHPFMLPSPLYSVAEQDLIEHLCGALPAHKMRYGSSLE